MSTRTLVTSLALAATFVTSSAFADEPSPSTPLPVRPSHPVALAPESAGTGVAWKLGAIGLLAAGGVWALRRRKRVVGAASERKIRIVTRTAVGARSELLVVEVEGETMLLGVTPNGISRLADLPPREGETEATHADESVVGARFSALLRHANGTHENSEERSSRPKPVLAEPSPKKADIATTHDEVEGQARGLLRLAKRS